MCFSHSLPANVTDRPETAMPTASTSGIPGAVLTETQNKDIDLSAQKNPAQEDMDHTLSDYTTHFSPEIIQQFPKAGPCKAKNRGRKRRKTQILTDTPVRNAIAAEEAAKVSRKQLSHVKRRLNLASKPRQTG